MKAVCPRSEKTHLTHRPCPRGLSLAGSSLQRLLLGIFPRPLLSVLPDSPEPPTTLSTLVPGQLQLKSAGATLAGPTTQPAETGHL